jgi:hypothetical protein
MHVSTVDQVKDASTELPVDGASTVDQVEDAATALPDGVKRRKTPANPCVRYELREIKLLL